MPAAPATPAAAEAEARFPVVGHEKAALLRRRAARYTSGPGAPLGDDYEARAREFDDAARTLRRLLAGTAA